MIVFAWVNDEQTKRAYGSRTDAYATFRKMLDRGNPPDDLDSFLVDARNSRRGFGAVLQPRETGPDDAG